MATEYKYENDDERINFEFLDELRSSGITNMFEAAPHLQNARGITTKARAQSILIKWIETFGKRGCPGAGD